MIHLRFNFNQIKILKKLDFLNFIECILNFLKFEVQSNNWLIAYFKQFIVVKVFPSNVLFIIAKTFYNGFKSEKYGGQSIIFILFS